MHIIIIISIILHAIIFLIIVGVIVAGGFLAAFIWSVKNGQYEDPYGPSVRMLFDDEVASVTTDEDESENPENQESNEAK